MSAQGVQFVLRTVRTIILARLLTPGDFGIITMVVVVINFAQMFKDAGLSMATVQREEISHNQISTLFWINVFISVVLGICVLCCSPLVAKFYGRGQLTAVTAALSISFIVSGLSIQHAALLRRHMQFGSLAIVSIFAQIISLIITIILALYGLRYWALVFGMIVTAFVTVGLTFFFCPWVPGKFHRVSGVMDMLKFGGHLTAHNFIGYFARNADNILIGKYIDVDALGLYTKAYSLFMLPVSQIRQPITQVFMPVLSSLKKQPERYIKYYQRLIDIMASLIIPIAIYCIIEADFLIRILLGNQWIGAVPVFRILSICGVIQSISGTRGLVMLSHGFSRKTLIFGSVNGCLIVISFIIGLPFGITGVASAYTLTQMIVLVPSLFYCFSGTPVPVLLFLKTLFLPTLISTLSAGVAFAVSRTCIFNSTTSHLVFGGVFALTYLMISGFRRTMRETLMLMQAYFPRKVNL